MGNKLGMFFRLPLCFLLASLLFSCSNSEETSAEREFNELRTWTKQQEQRVEESTEAEWAEIEREYNERITNLDQKQQNLSEASQKEYQATKAKFQNWTNLNRQYAELQRQRQDTSSLSLNTDTTTVSPQWTQDLLGQYSDLNTVTAATAREAYITFMENVRSRHQDWSDAEWDQADRVLISLDERVDMFQKQLSVKDIAKINALEVEYKALETGDEAKGAYKDARD